MSAQPEQTTDRPEMDHRESSTPRDYLANERTLLAWARTGIAVMGLGFVVARFNLAIRELTDTPSRGLATTFGVALVLCGALTLVLAAVRYLRVGAALSQSSYTWSPRLGLLLSGVLVLAGILLALYLVLSP